MDKTKTEDGQTVWPDYMKKYQVYPDKIAHFLKTIFLGSPLEDNQG